MSYPSKYSTVSYAEQFSCVVGTGYNLNELNQCIFWIRRWEQQSNCRRTHLHFLLLAQAEMPSGARQTQKSIVVHFFASGVDVTYKT
jgi:hypothetical protein